jgi:[ribosomal protein S5]-alanine N-acetyltransferase
MHAPEKVIVTLEPRTAAHAEALFAVLAEPALYEFIEEEPPASVEVLRDKFSFTESRRSPDGSQHWLNWVVRDASLGVAGYVQATVAADSQSPDAYVAYMIGSAFWGRGIACAAVAQMLDILVTEFGVATCFAVAERRNTRSVQLAQRLWFAEASPALAAQHGTAPHDMLLRKVLARAPGIGQNPRQGGESPDEGNATRGS